MGHNRKTCPDCLEEAKHREDSKEQRIEKRLSDIEKNIEEIIETLHNIMAE